MTMRRSLVVLLFAALASSALTWVLGWWAVPIAAALLAAWSGIVWATTLGVTLGWLLLLGADAVGGRIGAVDGTVGAVMGLPRSGLFLVTLCFALLLAWSSATVAAWLTQRVRSRRAVATS